MLKSPLRQEPREQRAAVIRSTHESSLLDWLQSTGRLISRNEVQEPDLLDEEEEISGLIDPDDVADIYDTDDDDVDFVDEE